VPARGSTQRRHPAVLAIQDLLMQLIDSQLLVIYAEEAREAHGPGAADALPPDTCRLVLAVGQQVRPGWVGGGVDVWMCGWRSAPLVAELQSSSRVFLAVPCTAKHNQPKAHSSSSLLQPLLFPLDAPLLLSECRSGSACAA